MKDGGLGLGLGREFLERFGLATQLIADLPIGDRNKAQGKDELDKYGEHIVDVDGLNDVVILLRFLATVGFEIIMEAK